MLKTKIRKTKISLLSFITFRQDTTKKKEEGDNEGRRSRRYDTNLAKMHKTKMRKTKISLHPFITYRQDTTKKEEEVGDNEGRRSRR